jgi:hypothetical protein
MIGVKHCRIKMYRKIIWSIIEARVYVNRTARHAPKELWSKSTAMNGRDQGYQGKV